MKTHLSWIGSATLVLFATPSWASDAEGWDDDFSSSSETPASESASTTAEATPPAVAAGPTLPPPYPFEISLAAQVYSRDFHFTDATTTSPSPHYLPLAVMPQLNAALFPFDAGGSAVLNRLGLNASFAMDPFTSAHAGGVTFTQTHVRYSLGVLAKIPVGPFTVDPNIAYAGHILAFSAQDGSAARVNTPNINYQMLELGGDCSFRGNLVSAKLGVRYLLVLDVGEIRSAAWFPNTRSSGVRWNGEVAFALSPSFDAIAAFEYRAYNFNFNPIPAGAPPERTVGGAVDQYVGLSLGVAFHVAPGPASVAAGVAATPPPAGGDGSSKPDPADFEDF